MSDVNRSTAAPLVAIPASGRTFTGHRKVRLGDVRPTGELRLDALTRYTQDVSNDDTTDAELEGDIAWVVRRTTVDVIRPAVFGEGLTFTTFCSGIGRRWAERRLQVLGQSGAYYEVATLWICVDEHRGRPKLLPPQFHELYGEAAGGRTVTARLEHGGEPPVEHQVREWTVRRSDLDLFNHVNNAAYWAVLEEFMPLEPAEGQSRRYIVEYRDGIGPADEVTLRWNEDGGAAQDLWWTLSEHQIAATATVTRLPPGWYQGTEAN